MNIDNFNQLYNLIIKRDPIFIESRLELEIQCKDESDAVSLRKDLSKLDINSEKHYQNKIRFKLEQPKFNLYWNGEDFRRRIFTKNEEQIDSKFNANILIFRFVDSQNQDQSFFYDFATGKTYLNFEEIQDIFLISNSKHFLKFLAFLKRREHQEDGYFHFVDHFSWDNNQIIFISSTKAGKLMMPFDRIIPDFDIHQSLEPKFTRFTGAFEEKDKAQKLPKFIKAELFNQLSAENKKDRLVTWINKMNEILDIAHQNFDIYLSDISIQNIKSQYIDAKDKHFAQLREILGKIASQIIALPISISAIAVATFNVPNTNNKNQTLWFLIVVFIIYTFYALFSLKLYKGDIEDTSEQYKRDFDKLENEYFFQNHPNEKQHFDRSKLKVKNKIDIMRWAINSYAVLLIFTNGIILLKLFADVNFYPVISVFIIEILFLVFYGSKIPNDLLSQET